MGNRWGNSVRLYFWGALKSLQMVNCSHEIKRWLLLGRKAMTTLDSILKSRDITLSTKVHLVKAMVFSRSHVWMWELDHKESWVPKKNWCFWIVLEKTLESPLDCKIKPVNPKHSMDAETPTVWPTVGWCEEPTHWKKLQTKGEGRDRGWDG